MRDAGLAHLLAISGLHVGLVAGLLFVGLRAVLALVPALALRYPIKKWAAAAAVLGAFAYALLAGFTVPTQRAFLAVGLIMLAVLLDRRGLSMRSVAWAALVILALRPESLLGASFQLSFAAATALVATYEVVRHRFAPRGAHAAALALPPWLRGAGLYLTGVALTTVVAGFATAPFAAFHFNRVADYGVVANLVAVPLTALWVMPCAIGSLLLMPLGLEDWGLDAMALGITGNRVTAPGQAATMRATATTPVMPLAGLIAAGLGGAWLCLWRRRWRLLGLAGPVAAFASIAAVTTPDLLVDGEGRLLAVGTADGGLAVSDLRRKAFTRDVWLRRAGLGTVAARWPTLGTSTDGRLRCDGLGCIYSLRGRRIAVVFGEDALAEDCWRADAVVSLVPVRRRCPAPGGVVDRFDLWRDGAHAIYVARDSLRIDSVNGRRGHRPWVVRRDASARATVTGGKGAAGQ